jgi:hypothetical protein
LLEGELLDSRAPHSWERMLDELSTVNIDYLIGREGRDAGRPGV